MSDSTEKPKIYFISFADSRMAAATTRIAKQAEAMNFFDEIHVMNEADLGEEFRERWKDVMRPGVRGFGYWCWKPYIIRRKLEQLEEGDILLYCDAGCHLNPGGIERLKIYCESLKNDSLGIKAFNAFSGIIDVRERRWTKGDVFEYFSCREQKNITESKQVAATQIILRKCETSINFFNDWLWTIENDFSLIDDSVSKSQNLRGFIEHRHDQSIFSVLYKLRGGVTFSEEETEVSIGKDMSSYPIWDVRDRGYKDKRFFSRLRRWVKAKILMSKIRIEKLRCRFCGEK